MALEPVYERAAWALALEPEVTALARGYDFLLVRFGHDKLGAVVRGGEGFTEVAKRILSLAQAVRTPLLEVAVIGGPVQIEPAIEGVRPQIEGQMLVDLHHVTDDGYHWESLGGGHGRRPLGELIARGVPSTVDRDRAEAKIAADITKSAVESATLERFQETVRGSVPKFTVVFLALIAVMFGVELFLGGPSKTPVIIRLGALSREHIADGEVWRLVSLAFLHGSFIHILLNGWVLWALGAWTERLLGASRFAVLITAAVLGGGIATYFFGGGLSVGASGGLWGVLGAQAVQAFGPAGDLPEALKKGARSAAIANLVLNVIVSFRPNIDMAGHFGGGIVGALVYFLVLRRGLPRWDDASFSPRATSIGMRAAGILAGAVLFGSLVAALASGRPWVLRQAPEVVRVEIEGVALDVPAMPRRDRFDGPITGDPTPTSQRFGSILEGPAWVRVSVVPVGSREELNTILGPGTKRPTEGGWVISETAGDRLFEERAGAMVGNDRGAIVEVVGWVELSDAWRGFAERTAGAASRVAPR